MTHEKLLARMRHLYAMAKEVDASPHEAAIALRRAQALTAEHGITEAELETQAVQMVPIVASTDGAPLPDWRVALASVAAEVHDCAAISSPDLTMSGAAGLALDAAAAQLTYGYLDETLERAVVAWRAARELRAVNSVAFEPLAEHTSVSFAGWATLTMMDGGGSEDDYRDGFARGIIAVWHELQAARRREERAAGDASSGGGALVVKKAAMVEEALEGRTAGERDPLPLRPPTAAAMDGVRDGHRVSLARQVERA